MNDWPDYEEIFGDLIDKPVVRRDKVADFGKKDASSIFKRLLKLSHKEKTMDEGFEHEEVLM